MQINLLKVFAQQWKRFLNITINKYRITTGIKVEARNDWKPSYDCVFIQKRVLFFWWKTIAISSNPPDAQEWIDGKLAKERFKPKVIKPKPKTKRKAVKKESAPI